MQKNMNWYKDYDVDFLKRICNVFKKNEKNLTFGQFSRIKERDLIKYLDSGNIIYSNNCCIVWRELKRNSFKKDFRGEKIYFSKGDVIVDRFSSFSIGEAKVLFGEFLKKVNKKTVYVNIFEEDRVSREIMSLFSFNWVSTKIMSSSEIIGFYSNSFKSCHISEKEKLSLCSASELLNKSSNVSDEEVKVIRQELESYSNFVQHYSHYNKRNSWLAFSIKGYDKDDPGFIIKPDEMSKKWKKENIEYLESKSEYTSISNLFPFTIKFAEKFGQLDRLRFMKLKSGGELSRHADITNKQAGASSGKIARLHLSIIDHQDVKYHSWDLRGKESVKSFDNSEVFYLDQRKPHRVVNKSSIDRINLVMDVIL
tara:strand:- start:694 stop:1797 length:1104 start_codon:yes stop_codon:yes gene_type:complete